MKDIDIEELNGLGYLAVVDEDLEDLMPQIIEHKFAELSGLEEAVQAQNTEHIQKLAHKVRGSHGIEQICMLGELIEQEARLENYEQAQAWVSRLRDFLENIELEYE